MYMSRLYTDARLHQVMFAYCDRETKLVTSQALCVAIHTWPRTAKQSSHLSTLPLLSGYR